MYQSIDNRITLWYYGGMEKPERQTWPPEGVQWYYSELQTTRLCSIIAAWIRFVKNAGYIRFGLRDWNCVATATCVCGGSELKNSAWLNENRTGISVVVAVDSRVSGEKTGCYLGIGHYALADVGSQLASLRNGSRDITAKVRQVGNYLRKQSARCRWFAKARKCQHHMESQLVGGLGGVTVRQRSVTKSLENGQFTESGVKRYLAVIITPAKYVVLAMAMVKRYIWKPTISNPLPHIRPSYFLWLTAGRYA